MPNSTRGSVKPGAVRRVGVEGCDKCGRCNGCGCVGGGGRRTRCTCCTQLIHVVAEPWRRRLWRSHGRPGLRLDAGCNFIGGRRDDHVLGQRRFNIGIQLNGVHGLAIERKHGCEGRCNRCGGCVGCRCVRCGPRRTCCTLCTHRTTPSLCLPVVRARSA